MIGSATISFPPVVDSTAGSTSSSGWLCACVLIVLLIGGAPAITAQCPLSDEDAPPLPPTAAELAGSSTLVGEPLLPEAGNLSDRVYTSRFFGFAIDLPIPLDGHRILIPPLQTGEHALLGIGFQNGKRSGTLTITAGAHVEVGHKATPQEKEEDFERWAQGKPPRQQREPSDAMQRSGHLNHVETHVHDIYGARYWTVIKNYTIRFTVETNDARFLKQAKQSIRAIKVYCPLDDGTLVRPDGKRFTPEGANYEGPSIPTDRVDEAISTRPADETIPPGETAAGTYRNPGLEFQFDLPLGWQALEPEPFGPPKDATAERIEYLLGACSKTLLRAAPAAEANPEPGIAPTLVLRALDQTCLSLPAPAAESDTLRSESLGEYLEMFGEFGEIKSNRLLTLSGRLFAVYDGMFPVTISGRQLEERAFETVAVTRYRKLLFVWSWTAASKAGLQAIPPGSTVFGEEKPLRLGPQVAAGGH